jgi:NADPH:quinone reductase-like Zn-dependent oxidoreductase
VQIARSLGATVVGVCSTRNVERVLALGADRVIDYLEALAAMMAGGELRPVIDRHYPLARVAEAIAYSETGRAQGKIIVDID